MSNLNPDMIELLAETLARRAPNAFAFPQDYGDNRSDLSLDKYSDREQKAYRRTAKALMETMRANGASLQQATV